MKRIRIMALLCCANLAIAADATLGQAGELIDLGQADEARALLQKLIQQHPNAPEPYNNLAVLEARLGNVEQASELLRRALATSSSYALSYQNLRQLEREQALQSYRRSLGLKQEKTMTPDLVLAEDIAPAAAVTVIEKPVEVIKVVEKEKLVTVPANCPDTSASSPVSGPAPTPTSTPLDVAQNWAKAWASQDISAYADHYVTDYSPADNMTHASWLGQRKERLESPSFIKLRLSNMVSEPINDSAVMVTFKQHYNSNTINDVVRKLLILVVENGRWKISQEQVLR